MTPVSRWLMNWYVAHRGYFYYCSCYCCNCTCTGMPAVAAGIDHRMIGVVENMMAVVGRIGSKAAAGTTAGKVGMTSLCSI